MGRITNWCRRWRFGFRRRSLEEGKRLSLERLEARQMLANGACLVVDFAESGEDFGVSAWLIVDADGHSDQQGSLLDIADSSRFVYLDDLAEELGNVFEQEDDDLGWMDSDHP